MFFSLAKPVTLNLNHWESRVSTSFRWSLMKTIDVTRFWLLSFPTCDWTFSFDVKLQDFLVMCTSCSKFSVCVWCECELYNGEFLWFLWSSISLRKYTSKSFCRKVEEAECIAVELRIQWLKRELTPLHCRHTKQTANIFFLRKWPILSISLSSLQPRMDLQS